MENFKYENQGTNTYVVYEISESEMLDSMTLGMITNNKIPGLAQAFFFQQDNAKFVKYNISSKVSAEQFLMGTVNKKRLIGVFKGIVNAMISAEEYMIDLSSLCLDMEYIYTDVSTCETVVICLPVTDLEKPIIDLKGFFKNIVFSTQFDQTENGDYIAKLINYLNSASVFSLYDFKEVLDVIEHGEKTVSANVTVVQQPVVTLEQQSSVQAPIEQHIQSQQLVRPEPIAETAPLQTEVASNPVVPKMEIPKKTEIPSGVGFAVPGKSVQQPALKKMNSQPEQEVTSTDEKEISFMYLMQHYNKENAALYKAQQEAKKAAKAAATPAKEDKKKDKKDKKSKKEQEPKMETRSSIPNAGFAIHGQPAEAPKPVVPNPTAVPTPAPMAPTPQPAAYTAPQPATYAAPQSTPVAPAPAPVASQSAPMAPPAGMTANFGETTVLSSAGIGETTVLGASAVMEEVKPYLVRSKNNEKIILDKPVFRIGKEKSYVDYFIGDNTAISRSHANIIIRDGEYFVMDTNSTNHTYVNGGMIQSNVETKISHGAMIRLANEDFEFKLY